MTESMHPTRLGYRLEGLTLKDGGVTLRDIIEHFGFTHKIACIDPITVTVGLLLEREDLVRIEIELQGAELTTGFVGRKGKEAARRLVSLQGITDVQVGDTVTIGQQETFVPEIFLYTPDTPARLGVQPGIDHRDFPVLGMVIQNGGRIVGKVHGHIAVMTEIVGEILLDDILFITAADHEIVDAVMAVGFHDMPEDGFTTDLHHRFGDQVSGFAQAGAEATG